MTLNKTLTFATTASPERSYR